MHVHNAYKFKMDRINNNREKVAASIFRRSRAAYSSVCGVIWSNFIFMQALMYMYVIITYKYERIRSRTAVKKVAKQFSHYKYMGIISDARGQLTLLSVVGVGQISNSSGLCMLSLPVNMKRIVRKTAEKNGNIDFLDTQGHLILWSVFGSGRILNSLKLLCVSSLPASMKRIRSKQPKKVATPFFPL